MQGLLLFLNSKCRSCKITSCFFFIISFCLGVGYGFQIDGSGGLATSACMVFILEETVKTVYSWRADLDFMGFGGESIGRNVLVLFFSFFLQFLGMSLIQYGLQRPIHREYY